MNLSTTEWSVIAHAKADLGVGEIARRLYSLLFSSGMSVEIVDLRASKSRQGLITRNKIAHFRNSSNVITCVNPDQIAMAIALQKLYRPDILNHIGFWAWELEDFPKEYNPAFRLVNEVWTFSAFVQRSIQKSTKVMVKNLSIPIPVPSRSTYYRRADFGLTEDTFVVVCSFDYFSDVNRKNPAGSIKAYLEAFGPSKKTKLIIKSINGGHFPTEQQNLRSLAFDRRDVIFIDEYYDSDKNLALLELADVVLSLHRAEGYGINLADAMARGTAVVATGYSGNLDFMNEANSVLIPYSLVPVSRYANLKVDSVWAEADIGAAAEALRQLYRDHKLRSRLANIARQSILLNHNLEVSVRKFSKEYCVR